MKPDFVVENEPLANKNTLGVGGNARYFCSVANVKDLLVVIEFTRQARIPYFALGSGSNLLVSAKGFNGLVIRYNNQEISVFEKRIWANAGASMASLVKLAQEKGITGFEKFAGLPGTIGGAVFGNAGCFGVEAWDFIEQVDFFDGKSITTRFRDQFKKPEYRWSEFKEHPNWLVVAVAFSLKYGDKEQIKKETERTREQRFASQPSEHNIGCIFKNPVFEGKRISAGKLIEECGLKGRFLWGAKVSDIHGNFMVRINQEGVSDSIVSAGFKTLSDIIIERVARITKEKFGQEIFLEKEIIEIGF